MVEDSSTMIALLFVGRETQKVHAPGSHLSCSRVALEENIKKKNLNIKMSMLSKTILIQLNQIQSFFKEKRPVF